MSGLSRLAAAATVPDGYDFGEGSEEAADFRRSAAQRERSGGDALRLYRADGDERAAEGGPTGWQQRGPLPRPLGAPGGSRGEIGIGRAAPERSGGVALGGRSTEEGGGGAAVASFPQLYRRDDDRPDRTGIAAGAASVPPKSSRQGEAGRPQVGTLAAGGGGARDENEGEGWSDDDDDIDLDGPEPAAGAAGRERDDPPPAPAVEGTGLSGRVARPRRPPPSASVPERASMAGGSERGGGGAVPPPAASAPSGTAAGGGGSPGSAPVVGEEEAAAVGGASSDSPGTNAADAPGTATVASSWSEVSDHSEDFVFVDMNDEDGIIPTRKRWIPRRFREGGGRGAGHMIPT